MAKEVNIRARVNGVIAAFALLALCLVGSLGNAEKADAWSWDPKVTVKGYASCGVLTLGTIESVYVEGSNGEKGWANLTGSGSKKDYSFTFTKVPTFGMNATFTGTCGGTPLYTSFRVIRPLSGTVYVRNLCFNYRGCI